MASPLSLWHRIPSSEGMHGYRAFYHETGRGAEVVRTSNGAWDTYATRRDPSNGFRRVLHGGQRIRGTLKEAQSFALHYMRTGELNRKQLDGEPFVGAE